MKLLPELEGRLPKDGDEVEKTVQFSDVREWNEKLGLKELGDEEIEELFRQWLSKNPSK